MKKLFVILSLLLSFKGLAQQSEIGLGAGLSTNGEPHGNMAYRGDKPAANFAAGLTYLRNLNKTFQLGADVYTVELASRTDKSYTWHSQDIGTDNKKLEYSHAAYSFCPVFNAKIVKWKEGYLYGGIAAGVVLATNYVTHGGLSPNTSDSYIAPDGGIGEIAGVQIGVNYDINTRWALNLQGAARYYNLSYDAPAPYYKNEKLQYGVLAYPVIGGIRYKMGFKKKINAKTGERELAPTRGSN